MAIQTAFVSKVNGVDIGRWRRYDAPFKVAPRQTEFNKIPSTFANDPILGSLKFTPPCKNKRAKKRLFMDLKAHITMLKSGAVGNKRGLPLFLATQEEVNGEIKNYSE